MTTATGPDDDEGPGGEVVPIRPDLDRDIVDADIVEHDPDPAPAPATARAVVQRWERPLPTRRQVVAAAGWWTVHGGKAAGSLVLRAPLLVLCEVRPISRGLGRVAAGWARWVQCTDLADAARVAEGNTRAKATEHVEARRSARAKLTFGALLLLAGTATWLGITRPGWAVLAAVAAVGVLDLVGRRGATTTETAPILPAGPIVAGASLSLLRRELADSLTGQGFDPDTTTIAQPQAVADRGWTVPYQSRHGIDDDHLRQVERDLQWRRRAVTSVAEPGNSARGELRIMLVDPLAATVDAPDPGPLSIHRPLPLGVVASGAVWSETLLRVHGAAVGASQSGKSSLIWQLVDVLRRCPEVECDGIDLTDGPATAACRRAFRRRGVDEDGARRILTEAVALIKARAAELARLAEHDDTPDEFDEKHQPTPDHPQRVVVIDEFALLAAHPELRGMAEHILRYGAKCAVTLFVAGQGATLADFGTSTVRAQVMLKVLFACARDDVLNLLGKDARDRGYRPDLLEPANGDQIQDAGKCFVQSASSRTAEPRRAYRLTQAEVRRRDRELGPRTHGAVDAVEVPAVLAALERAAGGADFVATADVLAGLGEGWTAKRLANEAARWRVSPVQRGSDKTRGYRAADVARAIRDL